MATLAVAMIIKNEEQFIEKVIKNVQPVADEIVITDTGSTDKTVGIVKKFKPRLYYFKWNSNESEARNFTISKCKSDWILFIDADEFLDIKQYGRIRKLISSKNGFIAYQVFIRNYFNTRINLRNLFEKDWKGLYFVNPAIRIFRNREKIFYSRPIYTSVSESLRNKANMVGNSNVVFHHLDILRNEGKKREKKKWYRNDVFKNLKKFPRNPEINYIAAHFYRLNGELKKAVRYYKRSLTFEPQYAKAKLSLGLAYVMLGKEARGLRLIRECEGNSEVFPLELESYLNMSYIMISHRMMKGIK